MSNERLRGAILGAGLTLSDVATHIEVDPKTVERWVSTGRVPHRAHRLKTAQLLQADDVFLWPTTATDPKTANARQAELVTLYGRIADRNGGVGAGALQGRRCGACQLEATASALAGYQAAAADEVVRCEECDRILVREAA